MEQELINHIAVLHKHLKEQLFFLQRMGRTQKAVEIKVCLEHGRKLIREIKRSEKDD